MKEKICIILIICIFMLSNINVYALDSIEQKNDASTESIDDRSSSNLNEKSEGKYLENKGIYQSEESQKEFDTSALNDKKEESKQNISTQSNDSSVKNKIEIEELTASTPTRKGYTVTAKIRSKLPITKVKMPTWTENNGKDDEVWYKANINDNGDGTYTAQITVSPKDHNGEAGKYITNVYAYDVTGRKKTYQLDVDVSQNQAPVISDVRVIKQTAAGYTISCKIEDDSDVSKVLVSTWTEKDGKQAQIWGRAKKEGERYVVDVETSSYRYQVGKYISNIYAYDDEGLRQVYKKEVVLKENKIKIEEVTASTPTRKGYTVTAKIRSKLPITKVKMPTWTENNGKDDEVWYKANINDNGDGTYTAQITVSPKDHNGEAGKYITNVYAYDVTGRKKTYRLSVEMPKNKAPVISNIKVTTNSKGYRISCTVKDDVLVKKVQIPTWTKRNGQDDLIWYSAKKSGNKYYVDVKMSKHNYGYGPYISHIYATDDDGAQICSTAAGTIYIPKPDLGGRPIIENVYVTNVTNSGYTVTCDVDSSSTITKVLMPTWTERNDQDDLVWHEAKRKKGNTFSYRINRSEHNNEYGKYKTDIYAFNDSGSTVFHLDSQDIGAGYVNPGWSVINGQKYFSDQTGTIVGNMPSKKVIDVSSYNGTIDWGRVAREGDVDGVIIRIAQHPNGSYIEDTQFANNLFGCINNNIPIGVYIYDYSHSTIDANNEADLVLSILRKYGVSPSQLQYGVYFDMERDQSQTGLSTLQMKDVAFTFLTKIANNGYATSIYSYRSLLNSYLNNPEIWKHVTWMAAYTKTIGWSNPYFHGPFGWQYTSEGTIPGINGYVDISCWYSV